MDINQETVLDALNDFERKPTEIPPVLEDYLLRIARNGEIMFPWGKLKPLLKRKLEVVCDEFNATTQEEIPCHVPNFDSFHYDALKKSILQAVEAFTSAPFTIQRLCELVTNPKKHYNRTDKYMRGIEKNVLVVSTIEPRTGGQNDANANVNPVVNGLMSDSPREDNDCFNNHENNENVSSSNLNTPANHVLLDNFANVFPTAACIPSPSNICINREIDSMDRDIDTNFIPTSECVQNPDVEFEPQVSLEIPEESSEPKEEEEQMDTSSEEQSCASDSCEVTSADTEQQQQPADTDTAKTDIDTTETDIDTTENDIDTTENDIDTTENDNDIDTTENDNDIDTTENDNDIDTTENDNDIDTTENDNDIDTTENDNDIDTTENDIDTTETDVKIENEIQDSKSEEQDDEEASETVSSAEEDVSASENLKIEADCSDSHSADTLIPSPDAIMSEREPLEPNQCQQDDTVSQSDDSVCDISDVSQSDEVCEPREVTSNEESVNGNAPEVSQSTATTSDSSGQCIESSSAEEPPVV